MVKPLLSICIPTYNRCEYLKNSLNSIICQSEFQDGKVEIVISDNASTDDTQKLCEEYASYFENIRYFRNPENVHDRNFPLVLKHGRGTFRKLSNDNLLYLPKSLCFLCDLVVQYKDTGKILFFLNGEKANPEEIMECRNFSQFVIYAGAATTAIRTFGLWESECDQITNDLSGCDLQLWQCQRIYEMAEAKGEALVINHKWMIKQEIAGKDLSYGLFQVLYLNFLTLLKPYVEKGFLPLDVFNSVRTEQLNSFVYAMVLHKKSNSGLIMSKTENLDELVLKEIHAAGQTVDFMKRYKKIKMFLPIKLWIKSTCVDAYTNFLSRRARQVLRESSRKQGDMR